jgi:alkylation response protein AidB-like acyl-CoA dehydrogenase
MKVMTCTAVWGFLPKEYGGGSVSNIDLQIVAEEVTAVDPGFATVLLVNGLELMPLRGSARRNRNANGSERRPAIRPTNIWRDGP